MSKIFWHIFFSNTCADNVLESRFGCPLSVPDTRMTTWSTSDTIFDISKKNYKILVLAGKRHVEPSESQSDLISKNMVIWCLKPFRPVQIDAFPYRSRYHTTSRSKVRKPKKIFSHFCIPYHFPYYLLYRPLQKAWKWRRYDFFQKIKIDI